MKKTSSLTPKLPKGDWVLDTGYKMLDTGYKMLDTGYKMLDTGYKMLDTGCREQDAGHWMPGLRFYISCTLHPVSCIQHPERGVTLVELLTVLAVVAVLMIVMAPHLRGGRQVWQVVGDRHPEVLQNARIGMDKMTREIRQAQSISDAGGNYVEFIDNDSADWRFQLNGGYLEYGLVGSLDVLAGPVDSLSLTYYEEDGVTVTTSAEDARSVLIQMATSDSEGIVSNVALSSRVFIRKDNAEELTILINEIMYSPSGNDSHWEWVELYNNTSASIDLAGWQLDSSSIDSVSSSIIPAGGYATITRRNSSVYWLFILFLPGSVIQLYVNGNMGLGDSGDTVILESATEEVDSVTYDSSWPAWSSSENYTLERIYPPEGDSNDSGNWERGPWGGTPGSQN